MLKSDQTEPFVFISSVEVSELVCKVCFLFRLKLSKLFFAMSCRRILVII